VVVGLCSGISAAGVAQVAAMAARSVCVPDTMLGGAGASLLSATARLAWAGAKGQ
jgi:hypothetical protein